MRKIFCAICIAAILVSCQKQQSGGKKIVIGLLPKKTEVPYFTTCNTGAQEAAEELGVEVIYDGPEDGAAQKAAEMIEKWTLQGVDVIAVSPDDKYVVGPAMKKAREKG